MTTEVAVPAENTEKAAKPPKPDHYAVICTSLYTKDLAALDAKVDALKSKGLTKMSRSALIRRALDALDIATVTSSDLHGTTATQKGNKWVGWPGLPTHGLGPTRRGHACGVV